MHESKVCWMKPGVKTLCSLSFGNFPFPLFWPILFQIRAASCKFDRAQRGSFCSWPTWLTLVKDMPHLTRRNGCTLSQQKRNTLKKHITVIQKRGRKGVKITNHYG